MWFLVQDLLNNQWSDRENLGMRHETAKANAELQSYFEYANDGVEVVSDGLWKSRLVNILSNREGCHAISCSTNCPGEWPNPAKIVVGVVGGVSLVVGGMRGCGLRRILLGAGGST